jgi:Holliday junction DNA helicase RuvA
MIAYLKGEIVRKSPTQVVLDVNGVGYAVNISLNTYSHIEQAERALLFTYYHVNQQDYQPSLFGFADEQERNIFTLLIEVKGVSVNSARVILSSMTAEEVRAAIVGEHEVAFRSVKGIGVKTAKQIILDLKDKMLKDSGDTLPGSLGGRFDLREEALGALVALQIPKIQAQKVLNQILKENPAVATVEQLIKLALKQLSQ